MKKEIAAPDNLQLRIDDLNERRKANIGNVLSLWICGVITEAECSALSKRVKDKYDLMIEQSKAMATLVKH